MVVIAFPNCVSAAYPELTAGCSWTSVRHIQAMGTTMVVCLPRSKPRPDQAQARTHSFRRLGHMTSTRGIRSFFALESMVYYTCWTP